MYVSFEDVLDNLSGLWLRVLSVYILDKFATHKIYSARYILFM